MILGTVGTTVGLLQTFRRLLGYEDSLYALGAEPELADHLIQTLAELDIAFREWAIPELGDDIRVVLYAGDFGIHTGPLFSYEMFKRYFKPWYGKIFSVIKKQKPNLFIFFHSFGSSRLILGDLIESGVDIFNTVHNIQADVPPENIMAMWEALREFGKY